MQLKRTLARVVRVLNRVGRLLQTVRRRHQTEQRVGFAVDLIDRSGRVGGLPEPFDAFHDLVGAEADIGGEVPAALTSAGEKEGGVDQESAALSRAPRVRPAAAARRGRLSPRPRPRDRTRDTFNPNTRRPRPGAPRPGSARSLMRAVRENVARPDFPNRARRLLVGVGKATGGLMQSQLDSRGLEVLEIRRGLRRGGRVRWSSTLRRRAVRTNPKSFADRPAVAEDPARGRD